MEKIVIDSCIFAKIFLDEEDSDKAVSFLEKVINQGTEIILPFLYSYEVLSTVIKNKGNSAEAFDILQSYEESVISLYKTDERLLQKTEEILQNGHIKSGFPYFYDSVYHALAIINDCDFVTADKAHYEKTKKLGNIKLLSDIE